MIDRHVRRALLPVAEAFQRWERKELESSDFTTGLVDRDTLPAELLDHLAGPIRLYEEQQARS